MGDNDSAGWVNDTTGSPRIRGNLEISKRRSGVFIGGDPEALRLLAEVLVWLADVDQQSFSKLPDGERLHKHLYARGPTEFVSLTQFSSETELCRLDAKGTGVFPAKYKRLEPAKKRKAIRVRKQTPAGGVEKGRRSLGRRRG